MKLIKINTDHYVVVDDSEIKVGDWTYHHVKGIYEARVDGAYTNQKKITHSTEPLEQYYGVIDGTIPFVYHKINPLSLSEVKELITEVDVEKKAINSWEGCDGCDTNDELFFTNGYQRGYNQALEDNKEKKYTEEDLKYMFECGRNYQNNAEITFKVSMEYIHPKTEWEVEFIDGKLKIK